MRRKLQGFLDQRLRLCPCQQHILRCAEESYSDCSTCQMRRYFADRSMSLDELNHRLTELHQRTDAYTRYWLRPLQDEVFPEHMWCCYCLAPWNEGYHPGREYILEEVGECRQWRHCPH